MTTRRIKIEERGDFFLKKTIPVVRLKGRWLLAAGFPAGRHVELTVIAPGILELRLAGVHKSPRISQS